MRIELYNKTVKLLEEAYDNGHLINGSCCACAVGNIIANANNYTFKTLDFGGNGIIRYIWNEATNLFFDYNNLSDEDKLILEERINNTGFTRKELLKIEKAFEKNGDKRKGLDNVIEELKKCL